MRWNNVEKKDNNTLSGFHIKSRNGEPLKVHPKKYVWHIPKKLRGLNIQPGDVVSARVGEIKAPVLVTEVFREEIEEAGKTYNFITALHERAPKKE